MWRGLAGETVDGAVEAVRKRDGLLDGDCDSAICIGAVADRDASGGVHEENFARQKTRIASM